MTEHTILQALNEASVNAGQAISCIDERFNEQHLLDRCRVYSTFVQQHQSLSTVAELPAAATMMWRQPISPAHILRIAASLQEMRCNARRSLGDRDLLNELCTAGGWMTGIASIAFHQEEHSKADVTRARECGERPKVCGGVALFWVELALGGLADVSKERSRRL